MVVFKRSLCWTMVWMLSLLLSACATPRQSLLMLDAPPDIPLQFELESVPFYPQRDFQSGPAAVAMLISYSGKPVSMEMLTPIVYVPELKTTLPGGMLAAPNRFDRLAILLDGDLTAVLREIADGKPVLVMQNLGFESYPIWHYAVLIGYDLTKQELILRSGEQRRLVNSFVEFERSWQRAKFWAMVVVAPDVIPLTTNEFEFVRAVKSLETRATAEVNVQAYKAGLRQWPGSVKLQMGLGNASFVAKNYSQAARAFAMAAELNPQMAEAWDRLASAQLRQGQVRPALEAIERAVKLDPGNSLYQRRKLKIIEAL